MYSKNILPILMFYLSFYHTPKCAYASKWIDIFVKHLLEGRQLHQLTIFKSSKLINADGVQFFQKLYHETVATSIMDTDSMYINSDDRALDFPIFENPRPATLYVIFDTVARLDNDSEIKRIALLISSLTELSPRKIIRPKCLLILFIEDGFTLESSVVYTILKFAWSYEFLDFTILKVEHHTKYDRCHERILYYNPFFRSFYNDCYTADTVLFPDKIIDVNGYKLTVPFFNAPPFMMKSPDNSSVVVGSVFSAIEAIKRKCNFTLNILTHNKIHNDEVGEFPEKFNAFTAHDRLITGDVDLVPLQYFVEYIVSKSTENQLISDVFHFDKTILITPIWYESRNNSKLQVLIVWFLGIVITVSLVDLIYSFGTQGKRLLSFTVVQIILNQPILNRHQSSIQKYFFIYFVIVSMIYLSNFYANLTKSSVVNTEIPLENYDDISKYTTKVYADKTLRDFLSTRIESKKFYSMIKLTNTTYDCINEILNGKNIACLTTAMRIKQLYENYYKSNNLKKNLRIVDFNFHNSAKGYMFRKNFPFLEQFNKIFQKILESKMLKLWYERETSFVRNVMDTEECNVLSQDLAFISIVGMLLSIITFIIEILYWNYWNRLKAKLVKP